TAFGLAPERARKWVVDHLSGIRALRRRGQVLGGLLLIPMGQFFGCRRVSMTGVAGVSVVPAARGQGVATRLMTAALREMRRGNALSALYPATMPLYRRVGYELAGARYRVEVPVRLIGAAER